MLVVSFSFVLLLLHNAPQDVGGEDDTTAASTTATVPTTTEIPSTTAEPNTTAVPTKPTEATTTAAPTTVAPDGDCCDEFVTTDPPAGPLFPSEAFVITSSCSCKSSNKSLCPVIVMGEEAQGFVSLEVDFLENARNICEVRATIKPVLSQFSKRGIEVPLTVQALNQQVVLRVRFQKSENGGKCMQDVDCWHSWDQMCDNTTCSCYEDVPSFVKIEEKCFTASKYGENCKYDEQCMSTDSDSICSDDNRRCKCKKGYWIISDSKPICITTAKFGESCKYNEECMSNDNYTVCSAEQKCKCKEGLKIKSVSDTICTKSFAGKMFANQFTVYATAISSVILFSLMM